MLTRLFSSHNQVVTNPMKAIKLRQRKRIQSKLASRKRKASTENRHRSNKRRRVE